MVLEARQDRLGLEWLPRLVVIIDEYADMIKQLPDFETALEKIASLGRSLGVHLVLAAQEPTGSISAGIQANTDVRIALRVQKTEVSINLIESPGASAISNAYAGRAYVSLRNPRSPNWSKLRDRPARFRRATRMLWSFIVSDSRDRRWPRPRRSASRRSRPARQISMADAILAAYAANEHETPRRPWTDPLPAVIPLETVLSGSPRAPERHPIALLDDPDNQAQYPWGWDITGGNLLLYGIAGSGTTTALAAIALTLASAFSADDLHIYVLDYGAGEQAALSDLPHVGAVVGAADRQRQIRRAEQPTRVSLSDGRQHGAAGEVIRTATGCPD